jgi:protein O-mannosyl-transferase
LADKKINKTVLTWVCIAVITVITYFVFSPSLNDGFTNWDDNIYITDNPLVVNNSVPLVKIFETPIAANYHPLTVLSLALNYQNDKLNPWGYHFENVILHLLNTILVFFFIFLLTRRNLLMAAIVSLFFGIHPMHVESVTWISERKDVLYVFFFLSGLITYLRYSETKKVAWYIFTFLFFILSCLSKGMAIVFPVILLLIDYLNGVKRERKIFLEKIPFFILSLIFGIITVKVQQHSQTVTMNTFPVSQRLMIASYGAILYIVKLFVPFKLSAFYPYSYINDYRSILLIFFLSPFILLGIIGALIYFFKKKKKEIVFGLLFYFVSIVLVLQFISVGSAVIADRYSYLSYTGLLFIVAYLINKVWQSKSGILTLMKYPVMVIVIIGAVIFSYRAYSRTQVWKNSNVLWTDVINNYPDAGMAYFSRALYYYNINEVEKAMADFTNALQLGRTNTDTYKRIYFNRGLLYAKYYKKNDSAITDLTKAIELDSTYLDAYDTRGLAYLYTGRANLAMADFNKAIELDSTYVDAYNNRALLYSKDGKNDLAIADYTKAIALNPSFALFYYNRGLCYNTLNLYENALDDFTMSIQLNPQNAYYYNTRGICNVNLQRYNEAIADLNKAIAYDPSSAIYYYNRGLCYKALNEYEKALNDFTKGIQLNPKNIDFYYDVIGVCNVSLQNYNEAIADFSKAIGLNPSVGGYWFNRSVAENKIGQSENAKADALKAQQLQGK